MKLKHILAILVLVSLAGVTHAASYCGNDLVGWMKEYEKADRNLSGVSHLEAGVYMGFVMGVYYANDDKIDSRANVTAGQAMAVVARYLKAHPEQWSEPAATLVKDALIDAFGARS